MSSSSARFFASLRVLLRVFASTPPLCVKHICQYPIAPPSLRGSEPPIRTPCSRSIRIAW